ncbi:hypothetical protein [Actinoallomurus sp. CA-150999]|uniref:hypothetical protein n=1 Tax=Actinoallomurus sp. CA-150999 TaxID=3239887 RepID=UPI003D8AF47D
MEAAEQHLRAAGTGGRGSDRAGLVAVRFASPQAAHDGHLLVEPSAAGAQVGAGVCTRTRVVAPAITPRVTSGSGLS